MKLSDFRKNITIFLKKIPNLPETISAYVNLAEFSDVFLYPKKLSYSSSNAYIKKIRVREPGEASSLLKKLKKMYQKYRVFL